MFIDEDVLSDKERKNPPGPFQNKAIFSQKLRLSPQLFSASRQTEHLVRTSSGHDDCA
jgi:hypothetical protein